MWDDSFYRKRVVPKLYFFKKYKKQKNVTIHS